MKLTILIADKSQSYLEISKKMLKFHYENCEVEFAISGKECTDKVCRSNYDLILIDQDLGDANGLEVIETLKAKGVKSPLILLVEEGDEEIALQSIEKGASDYIIKVRGYLTALPFTVRNILERKKLTKAKLKKSTRVGVTEQADLKKGFFILDRRLRFLSANNRIEELTGYSEDELMELSIVDLFSKEKEIHFYEWMDAVNENNKEAAPFQIEIFNKTGDKIPLELELATVKDANQEVVSYRGKAEVVEGTHLSQQKAGEKIDQLNLIVEVSHAINDCIHESLNVLLERMAEIACLKFRFKRSTVALLDRRKKAFIKQAMVGYASLPVVDNRIIEVPYEVIDRIFADRFRVKVLYYNQDHRDTASYLNSSLPERRTQKRRPPNQWHKRDLILVNLMNRQNQTFGYISMDDPNVDQMPTRDTFHNLEIFGQLVSFAIENFYRFSALEKRSRRLKQLLVTSNIFKLYLSLNELLKEVVWSVRFSLDFNLVALGLISKRSGNLEIKAVACEDKIKMLQIGEITFPLNPFSQILKEEYSKGKSYFVTKKEDIFRSFKQIYYGAELTYETNGAWPAWAVILVPLKSRQGKIIGFLIVDDPSDCDLPNDEVIRTLEILANQVAVAIDNRILYVQTKMRLQEAKSDGATRTNNNATPDYSTPGIKNIVDRIFK
ncbi:MAG: response regulator [bacterium]